MLYKVVSAILIGFAFLETTTMQRLDGPEETKPGTDVITKAIEAHGGKSNLAKLASVRFQAKGTFYTLAPDPSGSFPVSLQYWHQAPNRTKYTLKSESDDQPLTVTLVFDGQNVWRKINDEGKHEGEIAMKACADSAYISKVKRLYPLLEEKTFALIPLPAEDVSGRPAKVVGVASKGRKDINLYFDKETGLLVKTAARLLDMDEIGKVRLNEEVFSGHKDFGGLKQFTKYVRFLDGKKNLELETVDLQLDAKIPAEAFGKP